MAVDTRQKRFGLMQLALPWRGISHPLTSGIDADERSVMLFQYGGIAWDAPSVDVGGPVGPLLTLFDWQPSY